MVPPTSNLMGAPTTPCAGRAIGNRDRRGSTANCMRGFYEFYGLNESGAGVAHFAPIGCQP